MRGLFITAVVGILMQTGGRPSVEHLTYDIAGGGTMTYALAVPSNYDSSEPVPLILALHPGGSNGAYYGSVNMQRIFEPALREWGAIIVAPDAPIRRWTDEIAERSVMALLAEVADDYSIDQTLSLIHI